MRRKAGYGVGLMPVEKDQWVWRRIVVLAITATSVTLPFCPGINSDVYWPFYTLSAAAIGAYIGFATWEYRGRITAPKRPRIDNPDDDYMG